MTEVLHNLIILTGFLLFFFLITEISDAVASEKDCPLLMSVSVHIPGSFIDISTIMAKKDTPKAEKKPEKAKAIKTLEEDDEFEDFPEDGKYILGNIV